VNAGLHLLATMALTAALITSTCVVAGLIDSYGDAIRGAETSDKTVDGRLHEADGRRVARLVSVLVLDDWARLSYNSPRDDAPQIQVAPRRT
jgi:hypothetical protein